MISTQDIKNKEVINIYDGKSLGFVEDIEVNLEKGTIEGIIVPEPRGFFSFFGKVGEQVIRWRDIKRIGDDVILVDVAGVLESDYDDYERDYVPQGQGRGQDYGRSYTPSHTPSFATGGTVQGLEQDQGRQDRGRQEQGRQEQGGWENVSRQERNFELQNSLESRENAEESGK